MIRMEFFKKISHLQCFLEIIILKYNQVTLQPSELENAARDS